MAKEDEMKVCVQAVLDEHPDVDRDKIDAIVRLIIKELDDFRWRELQHTKNDLPRNCSF